MSELSRRLAGEIEAAFARHHHVEHDEFEVEACEKRARLGGGGGDGDAIAVLAQKGGQQRAQPAVVVDDQDMRSVVGGGRRGTAISRFLRSRRAAADPRADQFDDAFALRRVDHREEERDRLRRAPSGPSCSIARSNRRVCTCASSRASFSPSRVA